MEGRGDFILLSIASHHTLHNLEMRYCGATVICIMYVDFVRSFTTIHIRLQNPYHFMT